MRKLVQDGCFLSCTTIPSVWATYGTTANGLSMGLSCSLFSAINKLLANIGDLQKLQQRRDAGRSYTERSCGMACHLMNTRAFTLSLSRYFRTHQTGKSFLRWNMIRNKAGCGDQIQKISRGMAYQSATSSATKERKVKALADRRASNTSK
jgi:hypothetical protein